MHTLSFLHQLTDSVKAGLESGSVLYTLTFGGNDGYYLQHTQNFHIKDYCSPHDSVGQIRDLRICLMGSQVMIILLIQTLHTDNDWQKFKSSEAKSIFYLLIANRYCKVKWKQFDSSDGQVPPLH